jgi:probable rRNA maturation factor
VIAVRNLQKKVPVSPKGIQRATRRLFFLEGKKIPGEITFLLVDDRLIREFNLLYLGRDCPTDVIAFDNGDILISTQTALRNARVFKATPQSEVYRYIIHGLLHLLGYDDDNRKNSCRMREKEEYYLRCLFTRPKP